MTCPGSWASIVCLNHRLELIIKDSFKSTQFEQICILLSNIHAVFERSPKRLRGLEELANVMGNENEREVLHPQKPSREPMVLDGSNTN